MSAKYDIIRKTYFVEWYYQNDARNRRRNFENETLTFLTDIFHSLRGNKMVKIVPITISATKILTDHVQNDDATVTKFM